tara:strand:+ start:3518 stop:5155 length:1638 start_codon:yes stop_codon:yes gene_type:complete
MRNEDFTNWSKEDLVKEIKKLKNRKKYGIVWEEQKTKEKFDKDVEGKLPILKEVKSKEIQTEKISPTNILIEGDNFHSLSVLNYTHNNSIDVIFIDPPYNTGNDDFKYNDKFVDKVDVYRHSKWISFMKKRLELAKKLLKQSGVIFITIDDNEFSQLKLLCDKVFHEENFVSTIPWQARKSVSNDTIVSQSHHYILLYAKNHKILQKRKINFRLRANKEKFSNPDNDPRGDWTADPLDGAGIRTNLSYEITNPNTGKKILPTSGRHWVTTEKEYHNLLKDNRIIFGKSGTGKPQRKRFWTEAEEKGLVIKSWWDDAGTTTNGTLELEQILGEKKFNNPKPVSLLKKILSFSTSHDSVILDFFAGSGTTGHAVLELNDMDKGSRKFILCTNNENEICTEVCYPRIKNVIKGYTNLKNEKVKGLGGNLKYFKTDFVDGEPTDKNKKKLVDQCTEMLCLKEDCFDELKQTKNYSIFKNHGDNYLGIIYDDDGIEPLKNQIKSLDKKFNVYVFSLDDSAREDEFEDVIDMVDLKPIPEVILNVYRRIFR